MGIPLSSSFDLQSALPLDSRTNVADITARDAIPAAYRYEGLKVYVVSEDKAYTLKDGILDANWVVEVTLLNEDDMASNSATDAPSQQSLVAYTNGHVS